MKYKYKDCYKIYTDGTKNDTNSGIGIFLEEDNITYNAKISKEIAIKNIELLAILEAIKITEKVENNSIIIFTDSKSACLSLINDNKNKTYENLIKKKITEIENKKFYIQYIPSHKGIKGNEIADEVAKDSQNSEITLEYGNTLEDTIRNIKNKIIKEWELYYNNANPTKGIYHRSITRNTVSLTPWFKKSELNTKDIKTICRLRTGHCFDKKYKCLIKIENNNNCDTCNVVEDATHIIEKCKKYERTRKKFKLLSNKKLADILKENVNGELKEICRFLEKIEYRL